MMMSAGGALASALRWRLLRQHAGVDLVLLLLSLAGEPVRIDPRAAWYPTALGPLVVPVATIPMQQRVRRLLAETRLPLGLRVSTALGWGDADAALVMAASSAKPLIADPEMERSLAGWAAAEARRLGVAGEGPLSAITIEGGPRQPSSDERAALADVRELLAPLAWPRWVGPLLLVPYGVDHPALAPGRARIVRPALPVLRLPGGDQARSELTVAIAGLALDLSAPPAGGWPAWLTVGVAGCARARADGSGIAERAMAERRAAAGKDAIAAVFTGPTPDPAVATAVCAALLHPSRRAHLPDLLELLRHGIGGAGAVATAYGLGLEALSAPR